MLVRLLLTVLTVAGAVPLRICTCGAAHLHHSRPSEPAAPQPAGVQTDDGPVGHHHDCPALKPRPSMSIAVPASIADPVPDPPLTIAFDLLLCSLVASPLTFAEPRTPDPPNRPLFVHVCNLRN